MRTVAIVSNSCAGLAMFRLELIQSLTSDGCRVFILAPDDCPHASARIRRVGVELIVTPVSRFSEDAVQLAREVWAVRRMLKRIKPDICLSFYLRCAVVGTLASRLAGVRTRAISIEGLGRTSTVGPHCKRTKPFTRFAVRALLRLTFSLSSRVFVMNEDDVDSTLRKGSRLRRRVILIAGAGVDLEFYARTSLGSPITFMFVGRLLPEKGVIEFAEAAKHIRVGFPDARFIIVGGADGSEQTFGPDRMRAWQDDGIECTGEVSDVRAQLSRATVFVLPSYREGASRSVQEAMAMGRPIITTDAPGCRQMIEPGINGYLVPVGDSDALAETMMRFLQQPGLAPRMGAHSRKIAERSFDVADINRRLIRGLLAAQSTSGDGWNPTIADFRHSS